MRLSCAIFFVICITYTMAIVGKWGQGAYAERGVQDTKLTADHICYDYGIRIFYEDIREYATSTHYLECDTPIVYYKASWGKIISFEDEFDDKGYLIVRVAFQDKEGKVRYRRWPVEVIEDDVVHGDKKIMIKYRDGASGVDIVAHKK